MNKVKMQHYEKIAEQITIIRNAEAVIEAAEEEISLLESLIAETENVDNVSDLVLNFMEGRDPMSSGQISEALSHLATRDAVSSAIYRLKRKGGLAYSDGLYSKVGTAFGAGV